jgi:xylono-1,5-lactonase
VKIDGLCHPWFHSSYSKNGFKLKEAQHMTNIKLLVKGEHKLAEAALWHEARKCFFWIDLYEPMLCSFDPATGLATQRVLEIAAPIGAIVATVHADSFLLSHGDGISVLNIDDLSLVPFADPENGRSDVIANDMKMDRWGRLWFGSSHAKEVLPRGALWCVEDAGHIHLGDVGFAISNGPAFSPDGTTLYFSDSFNRQILAYDLSQQDCKLRNRRIFASFNQAEGLPDGLTVDAAGCVWSAQWAGASIFRLSPSGEKMQRIAVPSGHVTSLAFHGKMLFITTARDGLSPEALENYPLSGSLFSYQAGVAGIPETLFKF